MKLTRYEMETTINFNAEEKHALLDTRDPVMVRRMDRLVKEFPDIYQVVEETSIGKTYRFPKRYAMPKKPRVLTEEQRLKASERFRAYRKEKTDDRERENV